MKNISIQLLMFICFSAFSMSALAQKTVTGVISDDSGELLPGVTVLEKGTGNGVSTDFDGVFSISLQGNAATLEVSFVGMESQEVIVGNQSSINIIMVTATGLLDEVVVTALGLSREKKSLGYSVGEVDSEELVRAPQENVLNSIAGKVSGVAISSTGAAGSSVSIVIRGATSLTTDNQPLFVIDGVPVFNTLNNVGGFGDGNDKVDYGNAISDLNPDDIESMTILKGPSAAALYGSRAGNGVVIVTTKSGKRSKGMGVTINSSTVFDTPYKYFEKHNLMANGSRPYTSDNFPSNEFGQLIIAEAADGWVGPELDKGTLAIQWPFTNAELESGIPVARPLKSHKNNPQNFFQTQITSINNISIEDNTERLNYRLSYNNMINSGFIPNSDLRRNSISLNSAYKLTDKFKVTSSLNFTKSSSGNRPSGDRGTNPMQAAYNINSHIDIRSLKDYWLPGFEGKKQNAPYTWGKPDNLNFNNPYFMANEINNSFTRNRIFGNVRFDYQLSEDWSIMGRYNYDEVNEIRESKISSGYFDEMDGSYGIQNIARQESNAEFLLSYNKSLDNWSFSGSIGGNILKVNSRNIKNYSKNGAGLILPNIFTIQNIAPENLIYNSGTSKRQINSLYALGNIGYKDIAYLDITGRNDWSSTLPKENNSFFYPSVSTSVLLNNIWDMGSNISLIKLRAGWAQVGNDTGPYALNQTLGAGGTWGNALQLSQPGSLLNPTLQSELNTSIEFGTDLSFFQSRLRFDATYYQSENENQILSVNLPPSSGYTRRLINAGLLSSKGFEAGLGITPVKTDDWNWDMNFVFSRNRTTIEKLSEGIDFYTLWTDAKGGAVTWVGEEIGNIIDRARVRVDDPNSQYDGWVLLNSVGEDDSDRTWQDGDGNRVAPIIGNFNPDFNLGLMTSVTYKNWKLAMTFDWRSGGQFVSQTHRYNESDLQTQRWIDRTYNLNNIDDVPAYILANADKFIYETSNVDDFYPIVGGPTAETGGLPFTGGDNITLNDGTFIPGVIGDYDDDGNFIATAENIGGPGTQILRYGDNYPWSFTKAATFNADFIKLRDISLSYRIPKNLARKAGLQNATVSVYSRNIILWTAAGINIDPELAFQPGQGSGFKQGIERYNVTPWAIPLGIKLNISF